MIDFTIYETFDCIGFDLLYTGTLSYYYTKDKAMNSVDVTLEECLLELSHEYVNIVSCLTNVIKEQLKEELENYFWKSTYWEEKYLDATTN